MKFVYWLILAGLILFAVYTISHRSIPQNKSSKIQVTASFYPMFFFASQIGGNKADVQNITPAGAEPHDYEPTPQDMVWIENSNLLVINGGYLEAWESKIKNILKDSSTVIVTAANGLINDKDPHVWLSPPLAKEEVKAILTGFIKIDPKNKNYYQTNTNKLVGQLNQLDRDYRQGLAVCHIRDFVTAHAAFGYLAKAYGLNQIAIAGISPDEEPSAQKMAEIVDTVKKNNIQYIFFEKLISPKLANTIATETGAKTLVLDPIEGLTPAEMTAGKNYFTIMKNNLNNLRIALECR